jgi:hypothetical protein
MTELQRYEPPTTAVTTYAPASDTDGWIGVVAEVAKLAQNIANTDFVPEAMRGKPAAVTAAILAGREMGVGPMTSLQHIHVIKGKPGQSAHLMRGLVLAAGHEIDYVEVTDSRAIVRGRRTGETDWTHAEFTADQAKRARIDLGGYPADKLVARATARLCRRKFADVISGLAYTVEELQDGDAQLMGVGEAPAALPAGDSAPAKRTAQRASRGRKAAAAPDTPPAAPGPSTADTGGQGAAVPAGAAGPPLPGEDGYDDQERPHDDAPLDPDGPATPAMNRKMHALFREADVTDRDDRLYVTGLLLNRKLDTSKGLTVADGKAVIDALENLKAAGHDEGLVGAVNDLIRIAELRESEQDDAAQDAADDDTRSES